MNSFYSIEELRKLGFKSIGKNVFISRKASIYGAKNISIGNNVRIDDFCILSGNIHLGNYIHIAAYCGLYGGEVGIVINDFSTISSRCCIYAISDDYSGYSMTNPMIDSKYKNIENKEIIIGKHCIVGTNSTLLPGSKLNDGVAIGAHSLVNRECEKWSLYYGVPAKYKKQRSRNLLSLEKQFFSEMEGKINE